MASAAQIAANRRNARRSTGPRTAEGKARVARNGLKHGLCAIDALLPGEDEAAFAALLDDLAARFPPSDEEGLTSIFRVVDLMWRIARCARYEGALFADEADWAELERLCAHESRLSRRLGKALDALSSSLPQWRERKEPEKPSSPSTPLPRLRVAEGPSPKAAKARGRKGPVAQRREGEGQGSAPGVAPRSRRQRQYTQPLTPKLALDSRFRLAARAPP